MRRGHLVAEVEHMREATRLKQLLEQGPVIDIPLCHMHALRPEQRLPRALQRGGIEIVEIVKPGNTCRCHAVLTSGSLQEKAADHAESLSNFAHVWAASIGDATTNHG